MTRAPVKLSREMKLLLGLLLLVAAIGLWYVLTNKGNDTVTDAAVTPPAETVPVTTPDATGKGTSSSGPVSTGGGQVDVEVIPPFPTSDPATPTPAAAQDVAPTPGGINPDGTLAAVPGNNPFQPLRIDAAAGAGAPAGAGNSRSETLPASTASIPSPLPTASAPAVTPIQTGGALGLSPLPGSSGASDTVTGGAIPVPTIPGADGSSNPVVVTPIATGGTVATVPGTPGTSTAATGGTGVVTSGSSTPTPVTPGGATTGATITAGTPAALPGARPAPAPAPAPVAGVSVPSVTRLPGTTAAGLTAGTTPGNATGNGAATGSAGALPTTVPTPGTPDVITEVGSDLTGTPGTVSGASALDSFVQSQGLAFNAVVLGPVNTAIFRSKDGFVVVSVGQNLPDSPVTVKEVTATSATLSLGNDSKILELDKR
ncbi:hypothetical protein LAJ19_09165 [Deinococcus taeanensis]|uniref:hypothetical protein n=1 Tax=Deinococcus taeanensis TaxID=2737050 RepID=UPI001CDCBB4E|nr:hypothetical protein [Deinococcus taeanensis]UBV41817.1 hypothetical protein LAJ19_09165 [Deinococcus taeanensis]